jgi:DNA-binding IclR family transcriptional regulator
MKLSSLSKSFQVIDLLTENPQGLSLSELTEMLGFPNSTIHHILSTFREQDYVSQDPETKKYFAGFKFLTISSSILDNLDVRKSAYNDLRKLYQNCNETVHLSVLRNGKVTYIDKIQKPGGLSLATYIGFSTDPHAAAGGKILLSELSESEIKEMYKDRAMKMYAKNTITNMARLLEELGNTRKLGYAIDNEEYYEGVRCVAAPVRAGGRIISAVSVTGSIFTMTMERINQDLISMVMDTAERISSRLQW